MTILRQYLEDMYAVHATGAGTAETSYYPALEKLLSECGRTLSPRIICVLPLQNTGAGMPDGGFFPAERRRSNEPPLQGQRPSRGVLEAKAPEADLNTLEHSQQVAKYLHEYNQVLITNYRQFRLLVRENGVTRKVEDYTLADSPQAFWRDRAKIAEEHATLFPDFIQRCLLRSSPLTNAKDLAWFLASYAREARDRAERHPVSSFATVKAALEESLGIKFEGDKGERFFRSTLVQTLFYGIFSAWILWRRDPNRRNKTFAWHTAASYLRVPVLRKLFHEVAEPGALNATDITEVIERAEDTLNRVETGFFETFREEEAVAYFYEPFLEAFDPQLRKELGVWYTPKEIVHYMVERVDHLLRTELGQADGLASPDVFILDPCCGTGAYLTAVLHRIQRTLTEKHGDDTALIPHHLRKAALTRLFGFEIMPAPFVIAHLQIAALLEDAGAALSDDQRAGVYLTNALTGWVPEQHPKSVFPELDKEREAADHVKQRDSILVILGNPPYNGFAGIATDEERDLTTAYRDPVPGLPKPQGQGLNDLYVRFFRIAERRIVGSAEVKGNTDGRGIVCFISNNAWLDGLSHTSMRGRYLNTFQQIYIDNLNGDKYRTGKTTPDGKPDPSAFSTPQNREGIQVGTAIATLVRESQSGEASVHVRDLWGTGKLSHLERESRREAEPVYKALQTEPAIGVPFIPRTFSKAYTSWPKLPELIPSSWPGIKTSRDSVLVDMDSSVLEERMKFYLDQSVPDTEIAIAMPPLIEQNTNFNGIAVRRSLQQRGFRQWQMLRYAFRPFDNRHVYWEPTTNLLDRNREEYLRSAIFGDRTIVAQQKARGAASAPQVISTIGCIDLMDRSATCFPATIIDEPGGLLADQIQILQNLSTEARVYVESLHASEESLFPHALAIMHTPAYRAENAGALLGDWPRIPLPATAELLAHSASLGHRLAELLDAESSLELMGKWSFLGKLVLPQNVSMEEALKITAGWGGRGQGSTVMPGRGLSTERDWNATERERLTTLAATQNLSLDDALALLGSTCFDIHLNGAALWSGIPANVWSYTLGGYQVLKKWLSYREAPLLGRPLHPEEAAYFAQVVRRITAILLMGPALDASYAAIIPTATGLPS
ncbi:MAG: N-6 DNA methylase [Acidobacteria bacterium]|nr:N-6 DNA methylase [Acidobacteriota bacterium]